MRIVHIITAAAFAFGPTSAAFAVAPAGQFAPSSTLAHFQSADTAEIVQVAEYNRDKKFKKKKKHAARKAKKRNENREARNERQHGHDHSRSDSRSDLETAIGVLGAAAIISNLN